LRQCGGGAVRWGGHQTFTHLNLPMYTYVGFLQLGGEVNCDVGDGMGAPRFGWVNPTC
jgi:hypothetical protein